MPTIAPKKLNIGLSLSQSWLAKRGWKKADSHVEDVFYSNPYIQLAKQAEQAKLDFLFRADSVFLNQEVLEKEPGFSLLSPTLLLATIAQHTQHIGLVSTLSSSFTPPYLIARELQSLHWLSQGRAGWNIVTSLDGNYNFSNQAMPSSEIRYKKALECLDVVKKLWNSYPYDALIMDKQAGLFADSKKVMDIHHAGEYFHVKGALNVPMHPSGEPLIFQAGASEHGRDFAANVADVVFAATPDIDSGIELRQNLQERALKHGRKASSIRVLPGLSLILANDRKEAQEIYKHSVYDDDLQADRLRKYAYIKKHLNLDVSQFAADEPIDISRLEHPSQSMPSRTHTALLRRFIKEHKPTREQLLLRPEVVSSGHWQVIGTVDDAIEEIVMRSKVGACDGFIAVLGGSSASGDLFFNELIPRLVEKKLFVSDYKSALLRENLDI